jgi:transcriptional regulator with XRE-family HTH domain
MKTLSEIASFLRGRMKATGLTQSEMSAAAGLSRRTLTAVLSGEADYRVTTLIAVLDRLDYELVFVPKGATAGLTDEPRAPTKPMIKTRVERAQEVVKAPEASSGGNRGKPRSHDDD